MRRGRRFALAIWVALQLLLAQQLALAHMVGHLGEGLHQHAAQAAAVDGDEDTGAAHSLSHVCILCAGGPGFHSLPTARCDCAVADRASGGYAVAVPVAPTFHTPLSFRSRGPPSAP